MAERARSDEETRATDSKPGLCIAVVVHNVVHASFSPKNPGHVCERDMQRVERDHTEAVEQQTGAKSLPPNSEPSVPLQGGPNGRSDPASFVKRNAKREVFFVQPSRSRQRREEKKEDGRERNWAGNSSRRREKSGAEWRKREGEQVRLTGVEREEQGEGTKKSSLIKEDRNFETSTETNTRQQRQRNRDRHRDRDQRTRRRGDENKTDFQERNRAQQSGSKAVKEDIPEGQQKMNRDGDDRFIADSSHTKPPARQRGGAKFPKNRARDMDRNWRERLGEDDGTKSEMIGTTLPVRKPEAVQPVNEGKEKLAREEGGRETEKKKSKKSGRPAPKKASRSGGMIYTCIHVRNVWTW